MARTIKTGAIGLALIGLAGQAVAADLYTAPVGEVAPTHKLALSANVALTTDYVFRGFSQTAEGPAVQGGFDATCGQFYAGVWASSLDWGVDFSFSSNAASIEMDWYAGWKPKTDRITWDLGIIYYSYPNGRAPFAVAVGDRDPNYLELKVGGSAEVWKDGTLGVTVFYSPEYQYETGSTWTVETSFTQALPKMGRFTPTFSALLGWQSNEGTAQYRSAFGNGDDSYLYWNAGVTLGFHEKWSLDLRYWDTDISNAGGFCDGSATGVFQCDARFVATLKFTY